MTAGGRIKALGWFFIAIIYFVFAQQISLRAANGLSSGDWFLLVQNLILLFLLFIGFAAMEYAVQNQKEPLKAMGLVRRPGYRREFAVGAAIGWGGVVACVLPAALIGGLAVRFWTNSHQFFLILVNVLTLLVAALAEEVAFRGYPFQRLIEATGPTMATLLMSILFGLMHVFNTSASAASTLVTVLAGWLLSIAYLRTRGLWLPWGFHFGWNASLGILFGLPVSGITNFSAVITTREIGPIWLTGGNYGPEGSAVAAIVILALIPVLLKTTRDYAYRYTQPVIVPGGIPVDLDAAARRQHEAAMGPAAAPTEPKLVQIVSFDGSTGTEIPKAPAAPHPDAVDTAKAESSGESESSAEDETLP